MATNAELIHAISETYRIYSESLVMKDQITEIIHDINTKHGGKLPPGIERDPREMLQHVHRHLRTIEKSLQESTNGELMIGNFPTPDGKPCASFYFNGEHGRQTISLDDITRSINSGHKPVEHTITPDPITDSSRSRTHSHDNPPPPKATVYQRILQRKNTYRDWVKNHRAWGALISVTSIGSGLLIGKDAFHRIRSGLGYATEMDEFTLQTIHKPKSKTQVVLGSAEMLMATGLTVGGGYTGYVALKGKGHSNSI